MAADEQVLALPRAVFDQLGSFQGLTHDVDRYLPTLFAPDTLSYIPRKEAERDPTFKQIIPYVIMAFDGKFLTYVRGKRAGEQRLVGHRSIGIGGHINPADDMPLFDSGFRDAYQTAVEREVAEEVELRAGYSDRIVALLNDDSTEVGRVHLGVVHVWTLDGADVAKREQMITQMSFMTPAELRDVRESLESWSAFCLDNLPQLTAHTTSRAENSGSR